MNYDDIIIFDEDTTTEETIFDIATNGEAFDLDHFFDTIED